MDWLGRVFGLGRFIDWRFLFPKSERFSGLAIFAFSLPQSEGFLV